MIATATIAIRAHMPIRHSAERRRRAVEDGAPERPSASASSRSVRGRAAGAAPTSPAVPSSTAAVSFPSAQVSCAPQSQRWKNRSPRRVKRPRLPVSRVISMASSLHARPATVPRSTILRGDVRLDPG